MSSTGTLPSPWKPTALLAYRLGALALLAAAAVILAALAFEHFGGYDPCPLCLQERYAYYAGIPLLVLALVLLSLGAPRAAAAVFLVVALGFLANAGLGAYHAGVEWKFWPGPDTCAATARPLSTGGGVLEQLEKTRVIRCDEAPWHFLGLSFAGWNMVASLVLAVGAATAARKAWRS
jgi:disulfide bond formation protein DsbB